MTYQLTKYDIECLDRIQASAGGIGIENLLKSPINSMSASRAPGRLLTIREDKEQEEAMRKFAEERVKVTEELNRLRSNRRYNKKNPFWDIELHDKIMGGI